MNKNAKYIIYFIYILFIVACKVPAIETKIENKSTPLSFNNSTDTSNSVNINWKQYFNDSNLIALIDTALKNNQELNITLKEINISANEVLVRKGEYLPFVNLRGGAAVDKAGKYTWNGFSEDDLKENPDKGPKYVGDFMLGTFASWELDVWKKLRNAKKAAVLRYLSSIEGKNFMVTNIIAEIANSYYELIALDNLLATLNENIVIQENALEIIKVQKESAKVTQLAVNRFEAQLLNTKNLQYDIKQRIIETENRINFLTGKFPQHVNRDNTSFNRNILSSLSVGIPSQLLLNRPDIKQASLDLEASKMDIKVAKANFYPSFSLTAGIGFQAYNPIYLFKPQSLLYNLGGDFVAPLINKNAIKANYFTANAKQIQAVYNYERSILNAHVEVVNQLNAVENYSKSYETKEKEVAILNNSIDISNNLFSAARADYIEVLSTQREAIDSKIELIEIKLKQINAKVNIYKALGGGWK